MRGGGRARPAAEAALGRTVLVVGEDPELPVALRDRLDRTYVTVSEISPTDAVLRGRDRPWMVVGTGTAVAKPVLEMLAGGASLVMWRGSIPAGLPTHARSFERFSDLVEAIQGALGARVAGMRLAPGDGVTMPDGRHAANRTLEILVASHPHPVVAAARPLRGVAALLSSHRVPLHLERDRGGARLVDAAH